MSSKSAALRRPGTKMNPPWKKILASIRKIIADDSLGMKKDEPQKRPAARKEPEPPPPAPEPMVEDEAEVLDLAEVAKVSSPPAMVAPEPQPEPEPEPMMIAEPPPVMMAPPVMAPPPAPKAPVQTVAALEERIVSENTGALVGQPSRCCLATPRCRRLAARSRMSWRSCCGRCCGTGWTITCLASSKSSSRPRSSASRAADLSPLFGLPGKAGA